MRALALGDSYTIGELVAAAGRWPEQLAERLRGEGLPLDPPQLVARTGWTTAELDAAIDEAAPRGPFDLVTLLIGVNDQYRGLEVEGYRERFRGLLARAIGFAGDAPGRVVVVSIPDWGVTPHGADRDRVAIARAIDDFNAAAWREAMAAGTRFVDVTAASRSLGDAPGALAEDGLHPSAEQYRAWVDAIAPAARRALATAR